MEINILKHTVTIVVTPKINTLPRWKYGRRRLAHKVLEFTAHQRDDSKIGRIKAVRSLSGAGLVECKYWVEAAFLDNGWGGIR